MWLVNFFLGNNCIICNKKINSNIFPQWVCKNCLSQIIYIKKISCLRCGSPLQEKCLCNFLSNDIENVRSLILYDSIGKELIHKWKYSGYTFIIDIFRKKIENMNNFQKYDGILSVPIFFFKKLTRGFNQSNILSSIISKKFKINDYSKSIKKRYSKSQMSMKNYRARKENIKNKFKIVSPINCNYLLIVDDVITSCSTVNEISHELRKKGFKGKIDVFTLSLAI